jgi:pyrimidine-nucleoside phosphorylase
MAPWSAVDIIRRKRDGEALATSEIQALVEGLVAGRIPDYQMTAWLMAVYFRGLNPREMTDLTMAMARSGDLVDFGDDPRIVDKHSTGGVGDKTSLVVAPLVAAAGALVPKMSGRGLGHTGGTLDKLEAIPGFRIDLSPAQFRRAVAEAGLAIVGQTGNLVPADKLIYALRDVTATVDSIGLIASSVMSKKIAGGARRLVLDVKAGRGAFMPTAEKALELAGAMVDIGKQAGLAVVAVVTAMDQPLGRAVGNALEVVEAIRCLRGEGPDDLHREAVELGSHLAVMAGLCPDVKAAAARLDELLRTGQALERFRRMVRAQGGDPRVCDDPEAMLPRAPALAEAKAPVGGWVMGIDALAVGRLCMRLGAGRESKEDTIDPSVGVVLAAKVGDRVEKDQSFGVVHARTEAEAREGVRGLAAAYEISETPVAEPQMILGTVS